MGTSCTMHCELQRHKWPETQRFEHASQLDHRCMLCNLLQASVASMTPREVTAMLWATSSSQASQLSH